MAKWDAIVLTCASRNSSIAYQKELELKQKKGLIDSESLIICIEDPEKPIGSGGATLNALLIVAEAFSTREKSRMTNIELLKDAYILIMHMGRQYSFDLVAKGLSTLPLLEKSTGYLLNNFDLLYNTMSYQVACFDNNKFGSDPGVYVCSTDMIFFLPKSERIFINNKPICVLASLAEAQVAKNNGIYELDETKTKVKNIYFRPDDTILNKLQSENNGLFNLVSGIVYFNYEVAEKFFSLIMYPPMDACSYIGVDSGAAPLCISVFFDILLSCCSGIELDEYLSGSFKTNHTVAQHNQLSILRQARATLWQAMHGLHHIDIIVAKGPLKHVYMDNETFDHRRGLFTDLNSFMSVQSIFKQFDEFEPHHHLVKCLNVSKKNASISASSDASIIINCHLEKSNLKLFKNSILVDCNIQSCNLTIGENSYLSDLNLNGLVRKIPSNVFIQGASLKLESLNVETILNIVFGVKDNVTKKFSPNEDWTIMNESWEKFSRRCGITASDLWPSVVAGVDRTLSNAKLYPIFNLDVVSKDEMANLSEQFWIDLIQSATTSTPVANVVKWRQSVRLSLEEVACYANLEKLLSRRRHLFNLASVQTLVDAIVRNRPIQFASLIRNAVHDGYAELMLNLLDEEALKNSHNLILLPRIMIFISNILYEMASSHYSVRSGPGLNANWLSAFACIEANNIEQALSELSKERRKWMNRPDLIIRAARHYEGSMLAFIRLATSCFKLDSSNRIQLTPISEEEKRRQFEWVIAESPARLDLAGAWSDTPPITYECAGGSCVTNVAIRVNGRKPIGAKCRKLETDGKRSIRIVMKDNDEDGEDAAAATQLVFTDLDELRDYNKPQAAACLMKACLVFTHVVDFGAEAGDLDEQLGKKLGASLEVHTWTGLPHGSGLGTSSILIGCVLKALWRLMGVQVSNESLSYSILVVEQIMTTNGGWQDQVGSIWGGFKTTTAKNQLPLEIDVRELKLDAQFINEINSRLILIYTGITRLAKDLLLNVLRNWYAISKEIYDNVQELVKNGSRCARALENGDIKEFGECINRHRAQKLIMAPGSEPDSVKQLISILEPHVYGLAMAGAGGGGFVFGLTRQPNSDVEQLKQLLESSTCTRNMKIYEAKICNEGISLNFS